jgi:superoxide dismutase, Cu-Zn family
MRGMVGVVTVVLAASLTACERRADTPPAQPMEGVPETPVVPPEAGTAPGAPIAAGGVIVELVGSDGQSAGGARLEETAEGVLVSIRVSGLQPDSEHGLHFHENGQCDPPDFQSAGGHFAPHGRQHGLDNPAGPHAGDLPNIRANQQGVADTSFVAPNVRLTASVTEGLLRPGGTALVVHAGADDYRTDPSGESGARIACGVVRGG